ncbi:MAG TPA: c-type cytochrome domain-containing protein [Anaerolineales bacterium]|nr:c-type cytochrome domain-containing protein [Anaerolineales bacterium]
MKRIRAGLRRFFFPPAGAARWVRLAPYATLGVLTVLVLTASVFTWDYTNSPAFCGTACHTMPPEYTSYLTSPHARIDCVECHIGRGFIASRVSRKAGDLRHVILNITRHYEFPIRATSMRPARETCERCHFPEKFSDDSLRQILHYADDEANTPTTTYLVMKTGGGSKRLGLGRGIHWHIENQVYFWPTDDSQQSIPYVRVVDDQGQATEYVDVEAGIDPAQIPAGELVRMDCITCHNRITHLVLPPAESVDRLMNLGQIPTRIPDIRRQAVRVLGGQYTSDEEALQAIASLRDYYRQAEPTFAAQDPAAIDQAVAALQQAYRDSVFRDQKSDWNTHPNNVGHQNSPGCFRCHDGKHLNAAGQAVRLECNLCHSIPVVVGPGDLVADIEVSRGVEPPSHLTTNWIALHRQAFDETCAGCHTTADAGGISNTSFCSNSACHGNVWTYAGFDAPALREILEQQLPPTPSPTPPPTAAGPAATAAEVTWKSTIGPMLAGCTACHGENGTKGLNLSTYAGALAGGESGPAIVPGDPQASVLMQKQTAAQPHFRQLSPEEIEVIRSWILAGAPEG